MRLPPPEVVATWPRPNHINPETRGPALIIVELTTLPLALLCLALRLHVRVGILNKGGWDDWLMIAAAVGFALLPPRACEAERLTRPSERGQVFGSGVTICVILASTLFGWDVHAWDLSEDDMVSGRQVSLAVQALFVLATALAKVSILVSYLRFAPLDSLFRRLTHASIGLIVVANLAFFIILWAQCT